MRLYGHADHRSKRTHGDDRDFPSDKENFPEEPLVAVATQKQSVSDADNVGVQTESISPHKIDTEKWKPDNIKDYLK